MAQPHGGVRRGPEPPTGARGRSASKRTGGHDAERESCGATRGGAAGLHGVAPQTGNRVGGLWQFGVVCSVPASTATQSLLGALERHASGEAAISSAERTLERLCPGARAFQAGRGPGGSRQRNQDRPASGGIGFAGSSNCDAHAGPGRRSGFRLREHKPAQYRSGWSARLPEHETGTRTESARKRETESGDRRGAVCGVRHSLLWDWNLGGTPAGPAFSGQDCGIGASGGGARRGQRAEQQQRAARRDQTGGHRSGAQEQGAAQDRCVPRDREGSSVCGCRQNSRSPLERWIC